MSRAYRNVGSYTRAWSVSVRRPQATTDGGVCGDYAMSTPYPDGGYGDLWFTQDELNKLVADADEAGYQVVLHAIGDRAIESAMNAIETALDGGPNTLRHRIDHNSFARPDLLPRYSDIGIVPVIFGAFPTCQEVETGIYSSRFAAQLPWFENWRVFLDATTGLPVAWHGDWPYTPLDPFEHLYSYVTRQGIADDGTICRPPAWLAAQRIAVDEALPMMTINAAYVLFREAEVGSLKTGKFADLLILSDNPRTVDPDDLIDIEVWMTMIGGKVEYCAAGRESYCPSTASSHDGPAPTTATASASVPDSPPSNAVDGDRSTVWRRVGVRAGRTPGRHPIHTGHHHVEPIVGGMERDRGDDRGSRWKRVTARGSSPPRPDAVKRQSCSTLRAANTNQLVSSGNRSTPSASRYRRVQAKAAARIGYRPKSATPAFTPPPKRPTVEGDDGS